MTTFLSDKGIHLRTGAPHTPAQQGKIERTGRLIMELARTSTIAAKLPEMLWPFALQHATQINNLLPASANKHSKSPIKKLFKGIRIDKKPSIKTLRTFSCIAYVRKHDQETVRSAKMAPRAHKGHLVGIEGVQGRIYRVWLPSINKVVRACDVTFWEGDQQDTSDDKDIKLEAQLLNEEINTFKVDIGILNI